MGLLSRVTTFAPDLPDRIVLFAPEKAGKTSFGCFAPNPIVLMTTGETGLLTLIRSAQVPPTAHLPPSEESPNGFPSWSALVEGAEALRDEPHDFETLVLDTGNGAEQMLLSHVCNSSRTYKGNWTEFNSYGRGVSECLPIWTQFLGLLDEVRTRRKMRIIFLHHSKVKTFQDPTGKDYDQWRPEAVDKLWSLTHKWADVIAFYGNRVKVWNDKAEGEQRFLRVGPSPAIVAGNRYGMPDEITAGHGAQALWTEFDKQLRRAKAKGDRAMARKWSKDEFAALLARKGKGWKNALIWIDKSFGTGHVANKAEFAAVSSEHVAAYAAWLETQPDAPPPAAPASPPPPPVPAPAPQPQPAPAATADGEGEQGPDPTQASTAPTGPSASTTTSTPKTPATTEPAPRPMPAIERRTAPPAPRPTPGAEVQSLLVMAHALGLSWPEIRDRSADKGAEIAEACGIFGTEGMHVSELTLTQRNKLRTELEVRIAEKKQKAAQKAARKEQREREAALEGVSAS